MDEQQAERLARLAAKGRASKATATPPSPTTTAIANAPLPITAQLSAATSFSPPDPTTILAAAPVGLVAAAATAPAPTKRTTAPKGLPDGIEARPRSGRRRHVALAGKIMAAGLSTSTLFVGVASLAAAPAPSWEKKSSDQTAGDVANASATDPSATVDEASLSGDYGDESDGTDTNVATAAATPDESIAAPIETTLPVPETIVIVQKVPRYIYVDENGNPIDDPSQATDPPQAAPQSAKGAPRKSGGGAKSGGGGGGGGAAPAAADPTPQAAPAQQAPAQQAPAQTAAPTPKQTAAPAPPKPAPPATTPKCTGSKCP